MNIENIVTDLFLYSLSLCLDVCVWVGACVNHKRYCLGISITFPKEIQKDDESLFCSILGCPENESGINVQAV